MAISWSKRAPAKPWSLALRMALGAALWTFAALIVAGALLLQLFRAHLEAQFDAELRDDLLHLIALSAPARGDGVALSGALSAARFEKPFSGWSWQIARGDRVLAQSASLGPLSAAAPAPLLAAPEGGVGAFAAPGGLRARGIARVVTLSARSAPVRVAVARPQADLDAALGAFARLLAITLAALGLGLVASVALLVRLGLRPLGALRRKVLAMRAGASPEPEAWPRELAPVAAALDDLDRDVDRLVAHGRRRAADLAHAVKTPLSVINQLSAEVGDAPGEALRRQAARINATLDRHLGRSHAAGARHRRADAAACLADIAAAFAPDLAARGVALELDAAPASFQGDETDLYEMLGALLDNARKWAKSRIRAQSRIDGARLTIRVEDDGPGVPAERRAAIFAPGARLDEQAPGQGLGLAIVRDLAELYGGRAEIGDSALGGAAVALELPAAL